MLALTIAAVCALFVFATQAGVVPRAPLAGTYKLRNGQEVQMSDTQRAIANGQMQPKTSQEIARIARSITVTINAEVDDRDHPLGTGFFINPSQVQTVYHAVRDAADIR
jgi:hypothetical protein